MRFVKPRFYDDFKCIADKCPDTCCAGWQIMIDEESLERYACPHSEGQALANVPMEEGCKEAERRFEERLKQSIDWQEGSFYQYNGRCAMLNDRNLCDLVIEKGEDWLCNTCDRYPRHIEEFDGVREMSLSLSCPVAAHMMLELQEPLTFVVEEDEAPDPLEEEFEDFDFLLFTQLADARVVLFDIVQNRELSVEKRMRLVLEMGRLLQECLDDDRLFDMEEVIREFGEKNKMDSDSFRESEKHVSEQFDQIKDGFAQLCSLERLREDWSEVLEDARKTLYEGSYEQYAMISKEFKDSFCKRHNMAGDENDKESGNVTNEEAWSWEIFREQVLMFFLYTYFCGAVYDDCIFSKAALAVFSAFYIQEFVMCKWFLSDKHIDKQECIKIAYRYAREVEHSDENLIALEEWLLEKM